jgi:glycosyltransferase involved in cell wall biosynthesis
MLRWGVKSGILMLEYGFWESWMRIVQLAPGAGGGFYCENCIRDAMLVRQFHKLGHEAIALPMYLPSGDQQGDFEKGPMFFGGINVWLQQHLGLFRKTPRWLDRLFDGQKLLAKISSKTGLASAKELGQTTISMLQGSDGKQVKELNRMLDWLDEPENKPEVVILSNALLAGLAGPIRRRLGCAIVCLLQDEDGFVDGLGEPWSGRVWELMRRCGADADLFIAVSKYYQVVMAEKLGLKPPKIKQVYQGLNVGDYSPAARKPAEPVIGFLARMCEDNGLDILVDAVAILAKEKTAGAVRLKICGGKTSADKPFLRRIEDTIERYGLAGRVEWMDDFGIEDRKAFLRDITLFCVPYRKPAACGLSVLEAMASGVGFVEPNMGVFGELRELGQTGLLYDPNTPAALANILKLWVFNPQAAADMGRKARLAVETHFNIQKTSQSMIELMEGVIRK